MEAVAVGGMLSVILLLSFFQSGTLDQIIPTLGRFAFAGMRMLPAAQKVYQNATRLRFGKPALDALHVDMMERLDQEYREAFVGDGKDNQQLHLRNQIQMKDVAFTYPGASKVTIDQINLSIDANTIVGLAGSTGSGKTTVVDLIMGLLTPDHGNIMVDDIVITRDNIRSWQRSIGYVPQYIFLRDGSVASNIAFGVSQDEIDMQAVEKTAKIAEIHEFVVQELQNGYDTPVGCALYPAVRWATSAHWYC